MNRLGDSVTNSYRFVNRPNFGVVRDTANSIQPIKGRPLMASNDKNAFDANLSNKVSL